MLPNFLIIGAQRAGSTFVHECLEEHPDVFMVPGEISFFEDPDYLQSNINQFEELFDNVSQEKAIGIKRPAYLPKPECPERIYKHMPNAKLIVILRNPVERAISAYFHQMRNSFIPIKPVEEGMTKVINGEYKDSYPRSKEIIDFGFYHQHLMRYLRYFDTNQILVMLYSDIKVSPLESVKQIYRFLEINDEYIPKALKSKPQSSLYSLTRLRTLAISNPFIYTYNKDRTRLYVKQRQTLLGRLINRMVSLTDGLLLSRICSNSKPELSTNLKNRLFKIYEEDINRLEDFLGRKLTNWKLYPQGQGSREARRDIGA